MATDHGAVRTQLAHARVATAAERYPWPAGCEGRLRAHAPEHGDGRPGQHEEFALGPGRKTFIRTIPARHVAFRFMPVALCFEQLFRRIRRVPWQPVGQATAPCRTRSMRPSTM